MPNMDDEERDLILIAREHLDHEGQLFKIARHVIFPIHSKSNKDRVAARISRLLFRHSKCWRKVDTYGGPKVPMIPEQKWDAVVANRATHPLITDVMAFT